MNENYTVALLDSRYLRLVSPALSGFENLNDAAF